MNYPDVALSIRQPWAHYILHEGKDVENRQWSTRFRGPVLIHVGKGVDSDDSKDVTQDMPRGGIVGIAEIIDCVTEMESKWFSGRYGFVLRNARPLEFMPCRGALRFFRPDINVSALRPHGGRATENRSDVNKLLSDPEHRGVGSVQQDVLIPKRAPIVSR